MARISVTQIFGGNQKAAEAFLETIKESAIQLGISRTELTQLAKGVLPDIGQIVPGNNDRTIFNQAKLQELADSISSHGLIHPITVRQLPDTDLYQIVAGERRFRACELLSLETVSAIILDLSDEEAAALMLAENMPREDLDPIDEALAYSARINAYGWTVKDCAKKAGVSTIRVNFRLKLLKLHQDIQQLVRTENLPIGYAQILSDATLREDFQMIALRHYRDHQSPTPAWFRRIVGQLLEKQAQGHLFELPLLGGPLEAAILPQSEPADPPHPETTIPPKSGKSPREVLTRQASFWKEAAKAWNELGKPFKRQECEAAALALQSALQFI